MAKKILNHLKIILIIARKDIAQAIKDKMILGVIVGVFLLILPSQLIPLILQNETTSLAVIYGSDAIYLSNTLTKQEDTSAYSVTNLEDLQDGIASGRSKMIGLVIPDDFSVKVTQKEKINIDAYLPHWTKPNEADQLIRHFEDKIHALTDSPVEITVVDDQVYPDKDTRGSEVMFVLQMVNGIMTISLVLVPQLMMIEKETHTMDALLISPANLSDLVIGKGLVGFFYAGIAVLIIILMNLKIIAHWPLLIASVISGIAFAVLIGLLIGLLFENFQQATMVMWLVVTIAIAPAFIDLVLTVKLPEILETFVKWLPSGQLSNLVLMSLMSSVDNQMALLGLGSIWLVNLVLFGLNLWQIRQQMK